MIIILIIVLIAAAIIAPTLVVITRRRRGAVTPEPTTRRLKGKGKTVTEAKALETRDLSTKLEVIKSVFSDELGPEEKIRVLIKNKIPIESIAELNDDLLTHYFNRTFIMPPYALIRKLEVAKVPKEAQLEIIGEFLALPEDLQQFYLNEIDEITDEEV